MSTPSNCDSLSFRRSVEILLFSCSWSRAHWDDGEFCFVGTHTLDRDLVRDEDWPDRPDLDDDDDEEDDEEDEDEEEDDEY